MLILTSFKQQYENTLQKYSLQPDYPKKTTSLQKKLCSLIKDNYECEIAASSICDNSIQMREDWLNSCFDPFNVLNSLDYNNFFLEINVTNKLDADAVTLLFHREAGLYDQDFLDYIGLWYMIVTVCHKWLKSKGFHKTDISAYDKGLLLYAFIQSDEFILRFNKLFKKYYQKLQ